MNYDPKIWQSTSNRYRAVARLPEDMSGVEALREFAPEGYQELMEQFERRAADTFRRIYASRVEGCRAELTQEEWAEFKAAGGVSSW
jgi:hypothetical protein